MQRKTIAMVGFGDLGRRVAAQLPAGWDALGLRRNARDVPAGVEGIAVDLSDPDSLCVLGERAPDALLVTLSPGDRTASGYRRGFSEAMGTIIAGLAGHQPRRAWFVSSTRVYAEARGAWIDEAATLAAEDSHAVAILDAEHQLLDAIDGAVVLRAAGLYGDDPGPLLGRVASGQLSPAAPLHYTNRIHREDVAGFIAYALHAPDADAWPRIINLVDDAPVAMQAVEAWLCSQLGIACARPATPGAPSAGSRAHKRIGNARLHATGYQLRYPDYRVGYAAALERFRAHSEREDGLDFH